MAYNPYGGSPYGPPPSFSSFPPGSGAAPGMAPPPGLGPPPGMSSAPGFAPPPGVQQASVPTQANRPSGLPASFQPLPNLPNINFNAPVIRLGSLSQQPKESSGTPSRKDSSTPRESGGPGNRPGLGADRGIEQTRAAVRESMQALAPPTNEERLRTIFLHQIPDGVGGEEGVEKLLATVAKVRRWDSGKSQSSDHKGMPFGFAQLEDPDSLAMAVELLSDVEVPVKKQTPTVDGPPSEGDDAFEGIEKTKLLVAIDPITEKYLEAYRESRGDEARARTAKQLEVARTTLKQYIHGLFYPKAKVSKEGDNDVIMRDSGATAGENVEVVNIPLAQEDELADIPAEMRETVAAEIAAFRERSTQRDLERLRREEEMEELERRRNEAPRSSRLESPPPNGSNSVPLGPRGAPRDAPSGPRGQSNGTRMTFVNGGSNEDDDDTDASDEELWRRERSKQKVDQDKFYAEAERKWINRERQRAAALDRENERERAEEESFSRRMEEQLERERTWDDEREASRKSHPFYRDHAVWARKRTQERAEEAARDAADRRAEGDERRRHAAELEQAGALADSFLDQQAEEMAQQEPAGVVAAAAAATDAPQQRFTISFGAAAQRAQAQKSAPSRRTMAEVEGLLDDEEQDQTTRRQLIPIKFEPTTAADLMTEEEISKAIRALAQEIPTEKEGLWAWSVSWDHLDEAIITDKLRPFVEKKVVEYLGVQEQFLVEVVEEHLRKHGKPGELVDELAEALDEAAEDLVKKLWRMVIFFTESEKRGLPA